MVKACVAFKLEKFSVTSVKTFQYRWFYVIRIELFDMELFLNIPDAILPQDNN